MHKIDCVSKNLHKNQPKLFVQNPSKILILPNPLPPFPPLFFFHIKHSQAASAKLLSDLWGAGLKNDLATRVLFCDTKRRGEESIIQTSTHIILDVSLSKEEGEGENCLAFRFL